VETISKDFQIKRFSWFIFIWNYQRSTVTDITCTWYYHSLVNLIRNAWTKKGERRCIPTCIFHILYQHTDTSIVFQPVHSIFLVSILTLALYSYLYIHNSLSADCHYHCIPTCMFNIPFQHTDTIIVFLPVDSTFLVSILTLALYSYLCAQHSLSAYWHSLYSYLYIHNSLSAYWH